MNTPQEIIDIVTAFYNGTKIQVKLNSSWRWDSVESPSWDFSTYTYRIALKEKTTKDYYKYLIKNKNKNPYYESPNFFESLEDAIEAYKDCEAQIIKRIDNSKITIEED